MTPRAMARALDDGALEALASRGLVRRAAADVAAGQAVVVSETDAEAEVRVDGQTVRVLAGGPKLGGCTCPAPGICRHRLAALILLRAPGPEGESGGDVAPVGEGPAPKPSPVRTRAKTPKVKAAPEPRDPNAAMLEAAQAVLRRCYRSALAFAPHALEAEVRRLAAAGRVEALPRLAAHLRRLAGAFGPLRARRAEADPEGVLELLAETYALTIALKGALHEGGAGGGPEGAARLALVGQVRQDYAPIGDVVLHGLGAGLWTSPSGAHGVTAYFHVEGQDAALTLSHARADRTDVAFDPAQAFARDPVWGFPLARLCAGEVRLVGARAAPSGRLSASTETTATVADWTPTLAVVRGWNCVHGDWAALERWLQGLLAAGLTTPPRQETAVALVFARTAPVRFDELTQTLTWPLADRQGRWIGLTLPYEGVDRARIAVLESLVSKQRFWAVLATARVAEGRIELVPHGLWGERQHLLDFPDISHGTPAARAAPPALDPPALDLDGMIARLRARVGGATAGPNGFADIRSHADRLIDRGWRLMMRGADMDLALDHPAFARESADLARDLATAGLSPLARPFEAVAAAPRDEAACLRAAWAIVTARRQRARLAWMR